MQVYSDGDLRIKILEDVSKQMWTVNPECVTLVQRYPVTDQQEPADVLMQFEENPSNSQPPVTSPVVDRPEMRMLISKVARGNLEYVKELYETDKSIVRFILSIYWCKHHDLSLRAYF